WIAMDLFSQAEHDEEAQSILVSPDAAFLKRVDAAMDRLAPTLEREDIIRTSMANRGALIQVRDLDQALEVVNRVSPEHLELSMTAAEPGGGRVAQAAAISSAVIRRRHWVTTAPAPITCCRPAPRPGFPRRWACTISRNAVP